MINKKSILKPFKASSVKKVSRYHSKEKVSVIASNEAKKVSKQPKIKRLFWDLEVSPNLVFSWSLGNRISIGTEQLVSERAIICCSYKWQGEKKIHSLQWSKGNDKELCKKFIRILEQADEAVTHNGNSFDFKWLYGRCIYHGIKFKQNCKKVDTLLLARRTFRFNSNKLNYIGKFLNIGQKRDTGGFDTWKKIVLKNDKQALKKMVYYCEGDIKLLESVYNKLNPYIIKK